MDPRAHWTRRRFLQAAAAGLPLLLPARIARAQGAGSPNERIVTGHIGLGPAGRKHLRALRGSISAVCDVDAKRLYEGASLAGPGVEIYSDYRRILDRNDIDAIVIATPDHWHATMALEAIETGKDVYIEAPACRTLGEGLRLARTARYFGAVVQAGLGDVTMPLPAAGEAAVLGSANPGGGNPVADQEVPEDLDWPAWLGPMRDRPYNPDRLHGGDRWLLDFGGGQVRQQGASLFELALRAWPLGAPAAIEVYAEGLPQRSGLWDCPRELRAAISFPGLPHVIRWIQTPDAQNASMRMLTGDSDFTVHGTGGGMTHDGGEKVQARPPLETWLHAIRARDPRSGDLDRAVLAASLGTLANLSYRLGRKLTWRPEEARFADDPVADRFVEDNA